LKKYFTKALLYNILLAIGITAVLLFLVNWGLRVYTRHGQTMKVPDVRGKKFDEATDLLDKNHLSYEIMDSAYMPDKPALSIIEQNPKPETVVKSGRTIYLTVNATGAPLTDVPDLVGKSSYKYAKIQLEGLGFKVDEPVYKPDPHRDALLSMLINGRPLKPGAKAPRGATITLVLGQGLSNETIRAPYLIGLRYDEAVVKIREEYHLSIGATPGAESMSEAERARAFVWKQDPTYGRVVHLGEEIDLWLSKEMPEDINVDPSKYNTAPADTTE
jgi:beta-lactam-binding protein with PASTA domain